MVLVRDFIFWKRIKSGTSLQLMCENHPNSQDGWMKIKQMTLNTDPEGLTSAPSQTPNPSVVIIVFFSAVNEATKTYNVLKHEWCVYLSSFTHLSVYGRWVAAAAVLTPSCHQTVRFLHGYKWNHGDLSMLRCFGRWLFNNPEQKQSLNHSIKEWVGDMSSQPIISSPILETPGCGF